MERELVSLVLSCYDEPIFFFERNLNSLINQSYKNIEIIIFLDSSSNKDIENSIKRYIKKDRRIRFFKNKKNMGNSYCLNKAINIAKGKYIAISDSDDYNEKNRIEKQINFFKKNKNCHILVSETKNYLNGKEVKKNSKINFFPYLYSKILNNNRLAHPTLICKKNIFKEFRYDEKLKRCKDFDFFLRINKKYKIFKMKDKLIKYTLNSYSIKGEDKKYLKLKGRKIQSYYLFKVTLKNWNLYMKNIWYLILIFYCFLLFLYNNALFILIFFLFKIKKLINKINRLYL